MQNIVPSNFGSVMHLEPADPAVATDYGVSLFVSGRCIVSQVVLDFTTDANVANRNVFIGFTLAGLHPIAIAHTGPFNHPGSLTFTYYFDPNCTPGSSNLFGHVNSRIPGNIMSSGSLGFETQTANMQAGDQYSNCHIWGVLWLEPND